MKKTLILLCASAAMALSLSAVAQDFPVITPSASPPTVHAATEPMTPIDTIRSKTAAAWGITLSADAALTKGKPMLAPALPRHPDQVPVITEPVARYLRDRGAGHGGTGLSTVGLAARSQRQPFRT